jgi:large subunit ribosomal protein L9
LKVILTEDVLSLGKDGDIVEVKKGYARNFLLPKKKAVEATGKNLKAIEMQKELQTLKLQREKVKAEKITKELENITCIIEQKAGESDKLFGSVTAMDVAEKLESQGFKIDRKMIHLPEPIRQLGDFSVIIKLHPEVTATLPVKVVRANAK